jgi:hypothetical protein
MKKSAHYAMVLGVAASLPLASAAFAHHTVLYSGDPGDAMSYDRVVTIAPATKYISVARGETVKIVDASSGKNFVWRFDTPSWAVIHMQQLQAYSAISNQPVDAYVYETTKDNGGD